MEKLLLVSVGAILGANTRYLLSGWAAEKWGTAFPFGTMLINLSGSFVLGFFLTIATERFLIDPRWRVLLTVGFLGAFTTFSTYAFESVNLMLKGHWGLGLFNLVGSAILGGIAAMIGIYMGRLL